MKGRTFSCPINWLERLQYRVEDDGRVDEGKNDGGEVSTGLIEVERCIA